MTLGVVLAFFSLFNQFEHHAYAKLKDGSFVVVETTKGANTSHTLVSLNPSNSIPLSTVFWQTTDQKMDQVVVLGSHTSDPILIAKTVPQTASHIGTVWIVMPTKNWGQGWATALTEFSHDTALLAQGLDLYFIDKSGSVSANTVDRKKHPKGLGNYTFLQRVSQDTVIAFTANNFLVRLRYSPQATNNFEIIDYFDLKDAYSKSPMNTSHFIIHHVLNVISADEDYTALEVSVRPPGTTISQDRKVIIWSWRSKSIYAEIQRNTGESFFGFSPSSHALQFIDAQGTAFSTSMNGGKRNTSPKASIFSDAYLIIALSLPTQTSVSNRWVFLRQTRETWLDPPTSAPVSLPLTLPPAAPVAPAPTPQQLQPMLQLGPTDDDKRLTATRPHLINVPHTRTPFPNPTDIDQVKENLTVWYACAYDINLKENPKSVPSQMSQEQWFEFAKKSSPFRGTLFIEEPKPLSSRPTALELQIRRLTTNINAFVTGTIGIAFFGSVELVGNLPKDEILTFDQMAKRLFLLKNAERLLLDLKEKRRMGCDTALTLTHDDRSPTHEIPP